MTELARYDAMCQAIDAAYEVDEVKDIRNKAIALEHYFRLAQNPEPERRACEIRLRAERKAGELLAEIERAKRGRPQKTSTDTRFSNKPKTLRSLGISYDQSSKWQQLAAVPDRRLCYTPNSVRIEEARLAENTGRKHGGRPWQPGQSGNPAGKPKGATHRATRIAQALIDGAGEYIVNKVIEMAKDGDLTAIRLILERLVPARKVAPVRIELPKIETVEDVKQAVTHILEQQCAGELTADEAEGLLKTIEQLIKVAQLKELQERVERLEIMRSAVA